MDTKHIPGSLKCDVTTVPGIPRCPGRYVLYCKISFEKKWHMWKTNSAVQFHSFIFSNPVLKSFPSNCDKMWCVVLRRLLRECWCILALTSSIFRLYRSLAAATAARLLASAVACTQTPQYVGRHYSYSTQKQRQDSSMCPHFLCFTIQNVYANLVHHHGAVIKDTDTNSKTLIHLHILGWSYFLSELLRRKFSLTHLRLYCICF